MRHDQHTTTTLLHALSQQAGSSLCLSSPYFNITDSYRRTVLAADNQAATTIITAAPSANGFYGSAGASGFIPVAYAHMESRFIDAVCQARQQTRVQVREYARERWSFHAKGLWFESSAGSGHVEASMIGSSNFGAYMYAKACLLFARCSQADILIIYQANDRLSEISSHNWCC